MKNIDNEKHNELIKILSELVDTIKIMRQKNNQYLLIQNENEAQEWLQFLKKHINKEALKSLENEISDRLFFKFDIEIGDKELDDKRINLMKQFILKSNQYL